MWGPGDLNKIGKVARSLTAFAKELGRPRPDETSTALKIPSIGLALGGGFARGLAHIGVIKVFEEEGIPISFVAGTSVGSVIGAAYCSGMCAKELEEVASLVRFKTFARWTISRLGVASNDRMAGFLRRVLKCRHFEDLKIPLAVTATDFVSGDPVVFREGDLIDPVRASCAYPGMFLPVNINGRLLVDGLLAHSVPTVPLREMGAERVIGVHLSAGWVNMNGPRHVFDVIGQCFSIAQQKMCGIWEAAADMIVTPDVRGFSYDGFDRCKELIASGELVTRAAMPKIKSWLEQATPQPAAQQSVQATPLIVRA